MLQANRLEGPGDCERPFSPTTSSFMNLRYLCCFFILGSHRWFYGPDQQCLRYSSQSRAVRVWTVYDGGLSWSNPNDASGWMWESIIWRKLTYLWRSTITHIRLQRSHRVWFKRSRVSQVWVIECWRDDIFFILGSSSKSLWDFRLLITLWQTRVYNFLQFLLSKAIYTDEQHFYDILLKCKWNCHK